MCMQFTLLICEIRILNSELGVRVWGWVAGYSPHLTRSQVQINLKCTCAYKSDLGKEGSDLPLEFTYLF